MSAYMNRDEAIACRMTSGTVFGLLEYLFPMTNRARDAIMESAVPERK